MASGAALNLDDMLPSAAEGVCRTRLSVCGDWRRKSTQSPSKRPRTPLRAPMVLPLKVALLGATSGAEVADEQDGEADSSYRYVLMPVRFAS